MISEQETDRVPDRMILVSRSADPEIGAIQHEDRIRTPRRSSWTRHAFIVTPVIMAIVSLTFFATRNLVDAHAGRWWQRCDPATVNPSVSKAGQDHSKPIF